MQSTDKYVQQKSSIRGWNGSWDHKNIDIDTFSIKFGNGDCPHCPLQSIPYPAAKTDPVHAEAVTAKFEQCVFKDVNNNVCDVPFAPKALKILMFWAVSIKKRTATPRDPNHKSGLTQ